MRNVLLNLIFVFSMSLVSEGFYQPVTHSNLKTITPNTLEELKKALCNKRSKGRCTDTEPAKIIINKTFNFTASEGSKTETGCFHKSKPKQCLKIGQLKLNVANQCDGLRPTEVTYDVTGRSGLEVGSNKYLEGRNGGALIGKGLMLRDVENVEIKNLPITDINAQVIWGGDAVDIKNSKNILIDGCYFKNIGRQMIVTHFGSNTGILVKNTVFDGKTPFSSHCNGNHYWLWLFLGTADQIAMQNNVIFNTNGRGPHLVAQRDSKTILHLIQNIFYDIKDMGLIELEDNKSSILAEGNIIYNVHEVVHKCQGHVFLPKTKEEGKKCLPVLGRDCLINIIVKSNKASSKDSETVLEDFKTVKDIVVKPISMKNSITKLTKIPDVVKKLIK